MIILGAGLANAAGVSPSTDQPAHQYGISLLWERTPVAMHSAFDPFMRVQATGPIPPVAASSVEVWFHQGRVGWGALAPQADDDTAIAQIDAPLLDPWAVGSYELRLMIDGKLVASQWVEVVAPMWA